MRYLLVVFLTCSVIFGFLTYYYHNRANSYYELWKNSQDNNDYLLKERKKDHEKAIQIAERNRELEKEAENDKSDFDWYYNISHSPVILQLRKN